MRPKAQTAKTLSVGLTFKLRRSAHTPVVDDAYGWTRGKAEKSNQPLLKGTYRDTRDRIVKFFLRSSRDRNGALAQKLAGTTD
jgi:hypothetical protein